VIVLEAVLRRSGSTDRASAAFIALAALTACDPRDDTPETQSSGPKAAAEST
jgi:hypothetical protein